jgi:hypothetical protein
MSVISIGWHMLVKKYTARTILALTSLQGLYDHLTIGVDSGEDSDEVFEVVSHFPNTSAYRQNFNDFDGFGPMRQDVLDRVPEATYVGRSDADEILVTEPYKIRRWLAETRPDAVTCNTYYHADSGWCKAGQTYRNEGVRIWKYGTRAWVRPVHEYPIVIMGVDEPVESDILFNHISDKGAASKTDFHVKLMQKNVDRGEIAYKFFQAREHLISGDIDKAIALTTEYVKEDQENKFFSFEAAVRGLSEMCIGKGDYDYLIRILSELNKHPVVSECLAWAISMKGANNV